MAGPDRTCDGDRPVLASGRRRLPRLLTEYDAVKEVFGASRFTPVGFGPSLDAVLGGRPRRPALAAPASDGGMGHRQPRVHSRHVQAFMLWMALQTGQPVRLARDRRTGLFDHLRPPAAQLDAPGGGSGELHGRSC